MKKGDCVWYTDNSGISWDKGIVLQVITTRWFFWTRKQYLIERTPGWVRTYDRSDLLPVEED